MLVGAKVCDRIPFVVCMWFVCGNFDVFLMQVTRVFPGTKL